MTTTSSTARATILIVDDHPVMRRGLSQVVDDEVDMQVCGEAANVADGYRKIEELKPDLVIVDISLGEGVNGIELIKDLKAGSRTSNSSSSRCTTNCSMPSGLCEPAHSVTSTRMNRRPY